MELGNEISNKIRVNYCHARTCCIVPTRVTDFGLNFDNKTQISVQITHHYISIDKDDPLDSLLLNMAMWYPAE